MIIGLTGGYAAGKGEAAKYLESKGFAYHSLSDVIREDLRSDGLEVSRDNMIRRGNELRARSGPAVLARGIIRFLKGKDIVDSIRNPHEIEELRRQPDFLLLAFDAPVELRFERAMKRGRIENAATLEEFIAKERRENLADENNQQVSECMRRADRTIINDGTLEELYRKIDEAIAR